VDAKKVSTADLDAVDEQSRVLVDEAVAKARAAAYPPVENLLTDVYVSY
jgi:TPP-dependent pyruvate/acetoin dehydrogenase alpha subunit